MDGLTPPPRSQHNANSTSFLSPLLVSMVGIVATSIAIVIYHFFLVKYCIRRRQEPSNTAALAVPFVSAGVDKKVLDRIPVLALSAARGGDQLHLRSDQEECVVCLGKMEDEDLVRLLPICKHAFHVTCIDQWFLAHTSCPVCRSPILGQDIHIDIPSNTLQANEGSERESYRPMDDVEPSFPSARRTGLLRHCMSLDLPQSVERKPPRRLVAGLKRSLSMDQSFVMVDVQIEEENGVSNAESSSSSSSSSSSYSKRSELYRTRPGNQIDRVSSKLRRSFSRLRLGKGNQVGPILPY